MAGPDDDGTDRHHRLPSGPAVESFDWSGSLLRGLVPLRGARFELTPAPDRDTKLIYRFRLTGPLGAPLHVIRRRWLGNVMDEALAAIVVALT